MLGKRVAILVVMTVLALIVLGRVGDTLVDWLWFSSIGHVGVFWTIYGTRAVLFLAVLVLSAGVLWLSGGLALRFARGPALWPAAPLLRRPCPGGTGGGPSRRHRPRSGCSATSRPTCRGAFWLPARPSFSAC